MGTAQPKARSGCSSIVAVVVAIVCLFVGFAAGVGALYGLLYTDADAAAKLGLPHGERGGDAVRAAAEAPGEADAVAPAGQQASYALVYPIKETLRIQGDADQEAVYEQIVNRRLDLQRCFQATLSDAEQIKGEMSLQFTLEGSTGETVAAIARQNTTGSQALERCVVKNMRGWSFDEKTLPKGLTVVRFDALFLPITEQNAPR